LHHKRSKTMTRVQRERDTLQETYKEKKQTTRYRKKKTSVCSLYMWEETLLWSARGRRGQIRKGPISIEGEGEWFQGLPVCKKLGTQYLRKGGNKQKGKKEP